MLTTSQKNKWAEALESDNYTQARECMTDGVGHCCLAVFGIEVLEQRIFRDDVTIDGSPNRIVYEQIRDLLFDTVDTFIDYNDTTKLDFNQIAVKVRELPVSDG